MNVLATRSPLVSIYSCDKGGIHLVIRNVNIGMSPSEFCGLSNDINDALTRVDSGHWPSPYLSLTYLTTVLCLSINDLPDLAATMQEATAGIASTPELIDSLVREDKSQNLCHLQAPQIRSFGTDIKSIDKIDTDQLLDN